MTKAPRPEYCLGGATGKGENTMYMSDRPTDIGNLNKDKVYGGGNTLGSDYRWEAKPAKPAVSAGGSGGGGGGGGGGGAAAPNYYADYMSFLERQRAEQQAARNAAAEAARKAQQGQYDANVKKLNTAADDAQRQAYINYMMSKRDMGQQLSAQGLSGGAAESTWAGLYNGYGNSRASTEKSRLENLGDLQQTLQNNLAQIEQQRLSGEQADIQNYYSNLASLAAQNMQTKLSMQQASGGSSGNSYAKALAQNYYKLYQEATGNGYTPTEAANMANQGAGQYIYSLLASGLINQAQADAMMAGYGYNAR